MPCYNSLPIIPHPRLTFARDTIRAEDSEKEDAEYHYKAQLLGYTPDGATILQFCQSSSPLNPLLTPSAQARIIGTNTNGQVIVVLRNGKAIINVEADDAAQGLPVPGSSARQSTTSIKLEEPLPRKKSPAAALSSDSPTTVASSSYPRTGTSSTAVAEIRSTSTLSAGGCSPVSITPRGARSA